MKFIRKLLVVFILVTNSVMVCLFAKSVDVTGLPDQVDLVVGDNGRESYDLFLECIKKAKKSIELCPCMAGGRLLYELLDIIRERMNAEPELIVRILLQPTMLDQRDRDEVEAMRCLFPNRFGYVISNCIPLSLPFCNVIELHIKMSIVDGKYFILGGTNYEEFMCNTGDCTPEENNSPRRFMHFERPLAFRDQDIVGKNSELAEQLRKLFYGLYAIWDHYDKTFIFIKNPFEIASEYLPLPSNDTYIEDFENHPDKLSVETSRVRFLSSGPYIEGNNPIGQEYRNLIDGALKNVTVANLYFVPCKALMSSLKAAANRDIDMTIITNGINELSPSITETYTWGNRINYISILYGRSFFLWEKYKLVRSNPKKTKIYEFHVYQTQLHKKVMVVDSRYFVIGTYNFGLKSETCDYECALVIDSPKVAAKGLEILEKDKSLSICLSEKQMVDWFFNPKLYFLGHALANLMPA